MSSLNSIIKLLKHLSLTILDYTIPDKVRLIYYIKSKNILI